MIRSAVFAVLLLCFTTLPASAICNNKWLNPITEVCWDCLFPISVGGFSFFNKRPDTQNPSFPLCICPGIPPRPGLSIGLWEPARLTDVSNEMGCFVNMGFQMNFGLFSVGKSSDRTSEGTARGSRWQAHYYYYPLISWIGTVIDGLCLETTLFDVAYLSEFDPLWNIGELNNLLNPESVLFANPIAQSACAADCVKSSSGGLPMDSLFWCAGCAGPMYPLSGESNAHHGGVNASQAVSAKLVTRMHRLLLARKTASSNALCWNELQPIIKKSQYRFQVTRPRAATSGRYGCGPTGFSSQYVDKLREFPFKGESFGWLLWRKRNCCAL